MSTDFASATAIEAIEDEPTGAFRAVVPDGWQQGNGAFGGVVVGLLTRAIVASKGDETRRLRSLTADLVGPLLPGPVALRVSALRRGGSMSFYDAHLVQNGALVARASAALAAARAVEPPRVGSTAPPQPPWNDVPPLPIAPPLGPVFAPHYEYRSTGPLPFVGGAEAVTAGFIREKGAPRPFDEAAIMALLDAWWPTTLAVETAPRAVATVGYTMQLLLDPHGLPLGEPLFHRARGVASADNFLVEMRELWAGNALVAMNQQTFALLS
jgi:hypothetical protein